MKILGEEWSKENMGHFAASEAAKIARVWSGLGNTGYTLKTGDGTGKVTIDDKAEQGVKTELEERAAIFQKLHKEALEALKHGEPALLDLSEPVLATKQGILNRLLGEIEIAVAAAPPPPPPALAPVTGERLPGTTAILKPGDIVSTDQEGEILLTGGRRTRRKARKHTKKNVRKNNRKSKHMRNRRSNRRKSRK